MNFVLFCVFVNLVLDNYGKFVLVNYCLYVGFVNECLFNNFCFVMDQSVLFRRVVCVYLQENLRVIEIQGYWK